MTPISLTIITHGHPNHTIYINPDHVYTLEPSPTGTTIAFINNVAYEVMETIQTVLRLMERRNN